jgi:hypothetical protein
MFADLLLLLRLQGSGHDDTEMLDEACLPARPGGISEFNGSQQLAVGAKGEQGRSRGSNPAGWKQGGRVRKLNRREAGSDRLKDPPMAAIAVQKDIGGAEDAAGLSL